MALPFIPLYLAGEGDSVIMPTVLYVVYRIFSYFLLMFLFVGAFNSALNYIKNKKDLKQGSGWGRAALIYIVLFGIQITVNVFKQLF